MLEVRGKAQTAFRVRVSGIGNVKDFDDNVTRLRVKITQGPTSLLDRIVFVDLSIDEIVTYCDEEFLRRLADAITSRPKEE